MVDGLVNEAADNFNNFTNTSFLPMEAQMALSQYMEANVQDINITGNRYHIISKQQWLILYISIIVTEFDEELNRTLLLFNVSETIDVFTNISGLLNEPTGVTGQASTDEQALVNSIIANLCIVEDQIPIIIEQVVGANRNTCIQVPRFFFSKKKISRLVYKCSCLNLRCSRPDGWSIQPSAKGDSMSPLRCTSENLVP